MCLLLQDYLKPNLKSNNRFPMSEFSGDFCISIISSVHSAIIDSEQHYFHFFMFTTLFNRISYYVGLMFFRLPVEKPQNGRCY